MMAINVENFKCDALSLVREVMYYLARHAVRRRQTEISLIDNIISKVFWQKICKVENLKTDISILSGVD